MLWSCGGGQSGAQKQLTGAETDIAKFGLSQAKDVLPKATSGLESTRSFFQALLSGDRNTIMSLLTPEISSLSSQYDTGRKAGEEFAPRGGGRAAALEALPFQKAGQIEQLVSGARATGAQGVTQIDQLLSDIGLGEMGGGLNAANSAFDNIETAKQNQQQQQAQAGGAVGSLFALLALGA